MDYYIVCQKNIFLRMVAFLFKFSKKAINFLIIMEKYIMRKSLITTAVLTIAFSTSTAMADIDTNIKADIEADARGELEANAIGAGNNINVDAVAAIVNIENDASEGTNIKSELDLDIKANHRGDVEANAIAAGNNVEVSATAAVVSITNDSGTQ